VRTIQVVCDHPGKIVTLQKQVTDLQIKQLLPHFCDHTTFEQRIQQFRNDLDEARKTP
jgi:hypothetical protein